MSVEQLTNGNPDGSVMGRSDDKLGFFGATTVVKQTGAAAGTNTTTTQALANALRTAFNNLGMTTTVT